MPDRTLHSITFPGLVHRYVAPSVAPEYSAASRYDVGEFCVYNGTTYRCVQEISSPEAWTAAHWEELTVGEGLSVLKEEVVDLIEAYNYKPISFVSASVSPTAVETGAPLANMSASWNLSKVPASLTVNHASVTPQKVGSVTLSGVDSATITATDNGAPGIAPASASRTVSVARINAIYYGTAALPQLVDSAFIMGLASSGAKEVSTARARPNGIVVTAGAGELIWYAYPKRLGMSEFQIGALAGGFVVEEVSFVNSYSAPAEAYYVYHNEQPGLGTVTVYIT